MEQPIELSDSRMAEPYSGERYGFYKEDDCDITSIHETASKGLLDSTNAEDVTRPFPRQDVGFFQAEWYLGWKAIASMVLFYLGALLIAVIHFTLCIYLDGKPASSEVYITTASVVLAGTFQILLGASLTPAYTQYLWKILRRKAIKISTIEALFNFRSNPFGLFHKFVFGHAAVLALMTILWFLIPLAASFSPGALTVKSISPNITKSVTIPTYNASYTGNGTMSDLSAVSFTPFDYLITDPAATNPEWNLSLSTFFDFLPVSLQMLAATTSLSGQPRVIPSPCGPNCTYVHEFEGPSFKCDSTTINGTFLGISKNPFEEPVFSGSWYYFNSTPEGAGPSIFLNLSVLELPLIPYSSYDLHVGNASIVVTETNLACLPYRSLYTVTNSYTNNIQTLNYSITPLEKIPRVDGYSNGRNMSGTTGGSVSNASAVDKTDWVLGLGGIEWTEEDLLWYRNSQMMSIISGFATVLNGTCVSQLQYNGSLERPISYVKWATLGIQTTGSAGSMLQFLPFTQSFNQYDLWMSASSVLQPISFHISEESLNKLLGDYVMSIIPAYGAWNQTLDVTTFPSYNVYSFSRKSHLIIAYALCLALVLPLILLGIYALYQNGVAANDGGFIQILSTTTGSPRLQAAAAGNCLGGDGNLPQKLKDMKISFGELIHSRVEINGVVLRRAGFGTEEEVVPLIKGERYGSVTNT